MASSPHKEGTVDIATILQSVHLPLRWHPLQTQCHAPMSQKGFQDVFYLSARMAAGGQDLSVKNYLFERHLPHFATCCSVW